MAEMNWISIKDKIPEVGDWVLIYIPVKNESLIEIAMLDILRGFINPIIRKAPFNNATHWMPLPAPPIKNDKI